MYTFSLVSANNVVNLVSINCVNYFNILLIVESSSVIFLTNGMMPYAGFTNRQ